MKPEERMRALAEAGTQGSLTVSPSNNILAIFSEGWCVARVGNGPYWESYTPDDGANAERFTYMADAGRARLIADVIYEARALVSGYRDPETDELAESLARLDAYDGDEQ